MLIFKDRIEAGQLLAKKLQKYERNPKAIVLGLPRGGVVIAYHCARALQLPCDLLAVRKVGMPWQPECALGAVGYEGTRFIEQSLVRLGNLEHADLDALVHDQQQEAQRRMTVYRAGLGELDLNGRVAILVDDGIATGATMAVAVMVARKLHAGFVVVAVPVMPADSVERFKKLTDELVFIQAPDDLGAVGEFYHDFEQVTDEQVIALMKHGES